MNIEGTYTFQARPERIRQSLEDQEMLRRVIPGLEQLEQVSDGRYRVALHIKYAPLVGSYRGYVAISRDEQPDTYRFVIESDGGTDTISGIGDIQFHRNGNNTTITYKSTLTISKRGTHLSPTVSRGAAKLLMQQFLTALADQLHIDQEAFSIEHASHNGHQPLFSSSPETYAPLARGVVRTLSLGKANPQLEEVWVKRLQRIGLISGFLLLVWIGTRLPPRRR